MLTNKQPHGPLRLLLPMPILLYRVHMGWLLGGGFLKITHIGRKSSLPLKEGIKNERGSNG